MKEVPPVFIPPRKYNTAKRRREAEAVAAGLPISGGGSKRRHVEAASGSEPPENYDDGSDFDDDEYEGQEGSYPPSTHYGQPSPAFAPFDLPPVPKLEDADPFAIPFVDSRPGSQTPGGLSPVPYHATLSGTGVVHQAIPPQPYGSPAQVGTPVASGSGHSFQTLTAAPSSTLPLAGGYAPSPMGYTGAMANGSGLGASSSFVGERAPSFNTEPAKPRLIAKLPVKGEQPCEFSSLAASSPRRAS